MKLRWSGKQPWTTFIGAAVIGLLGTGTAIAAGKGPGFDDPNNWPEARSLMVFRLRQS